MTHATADIAIVHVGFRTWTYKGILNNEVVIGVVSSRHQARQRLVDWMARIAK